MNEASRVRWEEFIADNAAFWTCLMARTTQLKSMRNKKLLERKIDEIIGA